MTEKNKKQFGVWDGAHHVTIVGKLTEEALNFSVLDYAAMQAQKLTPAKECSQCDKTLQHKFFKEILTTCKTQRKFI